MEKIALPDFVMKDLRCIHPVFEIIKNGIVLTDQHSKILYVNPAFSVITGYSSLEAVGGNPGMLRSGFHDEQFYKKMWGKLQSDGFWEGEIWNRQKSGKIYPSLLTITELSNSKGVISNYLSVFSDITFLELDNSEKINLAFYDPLTRLPNRLMLKEHFNRMINFYKRKHYKQSSKLIKNEKIAFLFFDLNKFKLVNDTYGHVVGDKLLQAIAHQLRNITRATDIIARFGGDEFVGLALDMKTTAEIEDYCQRIQNIFSMPFNINGHEIKSSISIGVSLYPDDAENFDDLISKADKAMYCAKQKGCFLCFNNDISC